MPEPPAALTHTAKAKPTMSTILAERSRFLHVLGSLLVWVCIVPGQAMAAGLDPREADFQLTQQDGRIVFGNRQVSLEFATDTGAWLALRLQGIAENCIVPAPAPVDFRINGQWMIERNGARLLSLPELVREGSSARVRLRLAVTDYELRWTCSLPPDSASFDRSAELVRRPGATTQPVRFEGFLFQLPGIRIGSEQDCTLQVPGPFWPGRFIPAGTPYRSLPDKPMGFHSAPDAGFGILSISNAKLNRTLASWLETAGEVADHPGLYPEKSRLTFRHHEQRFVRLRPGDSVSSAVHHIEIVAGPVRNALAAYRRMVQRTMPPLPDPPPWTRNAVILEVYPAYFPDGFQGITRKLPFYREVGFTVLYLMPHWKGGYSPIDLYEVEPRYGTKEDLQSLVRTAHQLGMKVLFDMVIHGFNEKSPVVRQHPELFCRDESGQLARHPAWKSITCDWASPAYQQYMVDLVLHDLRTYDVDGYRVDAATYKGPNWDPALPYPAYRSGSAAPEVIRRMLQAMRRVKPDSAMLSEVFGPLYYSVCDMVHDNQTEAPQWLLEQIERGLLTAADYQSHLAAVYEALPPGLTRVMFARNHDTSWFYHFNGYTKAFLALEAIHVLFATPEVFAGDPRHGPHPDADPGVYEHYRKLLAAKAQMPELVTGQVLLYEVRSSNPMVFAGARRAAARTVLAAVSLSPRPERADLTLPDLPQRNLLWTDPVSGRQTRTLLAAGATTVELDPYQVLIAAVDQ